MERKYEKYLLDWKSDKNRKPMLLRGARQVGKSWLMEEFGKKYYKDFIHINFDQNEDIKEIFKINKDPLRILERLELAYGRNIVPGDTLIIFDEIQECPEAIASLKYFCEKTSDQHIVAAGSLLGIMLSEPASYPVGKVNVLDIYPLSFEEFLSATDEKLYEFYLSINKTSPIEQFFHNRLIETLNKYLVIGGMPECVASWIEYGMLERVTRIQKELLALYENDIGKHNKKTNAGRILLVLRSIVSQLAKSNGKFVYGNIKSGARAREFEEAIEWLVSAGLINRIYNVSKPEYPLSAFDKLDSFKLFFFDTGLLKTLAGMDNSSIVSGADYQFKGQLLENYCLQQIRSNTDIPVRYYSIKDMEIDFLIQKNNKIFPVEVKAGEDDRAPSFKKYIKQHNPDTAIRFSRNNYRKDGSITNVPLYLIGRTF